MDTGEAVTAAVAADHGLLVHWEEASAAVAVVGVALV